MKYVPPHNGDTEDPDRPYVDADPGNGIEGSYPAAKGIEHPQREIINAIIAAGLAPDELDLTQLAQAFARLGTPVGAEIDWPFETLPDGWYEEDGSLLNRADVPQLWAKVEASGAAVSEAVWSGGEFGKFSTGDGATTFRLPDFRGYSSRAWDHGRGVDSGRGLRSVQQDAFQGHLFRVRSRSNVQTATTGTSLALTNSTSQEGGNTTDSGLIQPVTDGVNGTPRTAAETRNKSIASMRIIFGGYS